MALIAVSDIASVTYVQARKFSHCSTRYQSAILKELILEGVIRTILEGAWPLVVE